MKHGFNTWLNELPSNNYQQDIEIKFIRGAVEFYHQKTVLAIKLDSIVEYLFQVNFFIEIVNCR